MTSDLYSSCGWKLAARSVIAGRARLPDDPYTCARRSDRNGNLMSARSRSLFSTLASLSRTGA